MSSLDLKSLSKESIEQLGLSHHDLWIVKILNQVYGPFETESLKHYALENETVFDEALATRLDTTDWKPFYSYALFQRRSPQVVKKETYQGPYWILDLGLKVGPVTQRDIEKRIEMGTLGLTDLISIDDGEHWNKVFEIEGFDRRILSGADLPVPPLESRFHETKVLLLEKLEAQQEMIKPSEELAQAHHLAQVRESKTLSFKIDEIPIHPTVDTIVSPALKWAVPTAVAVALVIAVGLKQMVSEDSLGTPEIADVQTDENRPSYKKNNSYKVNPSQSLEAQRRPASSHPVPRYAPSRIEPYQAESQYPTQMETHVGEPYPQNDPDMIDPIAENDQPDRQPSSEHSLVGRLPEEGETLDSVMNGSAEQPVVEEVSDF
jgi:hypothetical protein